MKRQMDDANIIMVNIGEIPIYCPMVTIRSTAVSNDTGKHTPPSKKNSKYKNKIP